GGVRALENVGRGVAGRGPWRGVRALWWERASRFYGLDRFPAYIFFDLLHRMLSPYQLNPFNLNPLKSLLEEVVHFERLRRESAVKLCLCAPNVLSGKIGVFSDNRSGGT